MRVAQRRAAQPRHGTAACARVMPVHILGHPVDMEPLIEAARKFELRVIEDATESLGATYQGRRSATSATWRASASTATRSSPPAAAACW